MIWLRIFVITLVLSLIIQGLLILFKVKLAFWKVVVMTLGLVGVLMPTLWFFTQAL